MSEQIEKLIKKAMLGSGVIKVVDEEKEKLELELRQFKSGEIFPQIISENKKLKEESDSLKAALDAERAKGKINSGIVEILGLETVVETIEAGDFEATGEKREELLEDIQKEIPIVKHLVETIENKCDEYYKKCDEISSLVDKIGDLDEKLIAERAKVEELEEENQRLGEAFMRKFDSIIDPGYSEYFDAQKVWRKFRKCGPCLYALAITKQEFDSRKKTINDLSAENERLKEELKNAEEVRAFAIEHGSEAGERALDMMVEGIERDGELRRLKIENERLLKEKEETKAFYEDAIEGLRKSGRFIIEERDKRYAYFEAENERLREAAAPNIKAVCRDCGKPNGAFRLYKIVGNGKEEYTCHGCALKVYNRTITAAFAGKAGKHD